MLRKKSYDIMILIAIVLISFFTYIEIIKYSETEKHIETEKYSENEKHSENEEFSENIWSGRIWNTKVKSIDDENNLCTLNLGYYGELEDLQKIKHISFALGSAYMTQIINVFDISLPNQTESYEGEYEDKGIFFIDFKNLQSTNIEIEFNDPTGDGDLEEIEQEKLLIEICWSYSFDGGIEKKDTISIN